MPNKKPRIVLCTVQSFPFAFSLSLFATDMTDIMAVQLVILLTIAVYAFLWARKVFNGERLPPGPKGLPILGNLLELSVDDVWVKYRDWGKEHGQFTSPPNQIVFMNQAS